MKKKLFFLMAAFMFATVSANAQIATENSNALDNIGVGITVGASTPLDFNSVLPLNPTAGIKITKDFTPVIGVQFEGLAIFNDNHFTDVKTMVKAANVGLNGVINLSNALYGYNGTPRFFEVGAVGGIGWMHVWDVSANNLTAKTGLDLMFNLGKNKAHSIVLTPAVYWNLNKFGNMEFNKHNSQLALNLGYIYHFKTSNGTHHFKTYDVGAMMNEISRLNGALEECEKREPKVIEKVVEKVIIKEGTSKDGNNVTPTTITTETTKIVANNGELWIVPFALNSDKITSEAMFILNQIGENTIVDIVATASPSGTKAYNQRLSERRAKNVASFLTRRGVKVNSAIGKGVDATSGKTAIVTVAH